MRAELGLPSVKGDDEHGGGMTGGFGGSMGGLGAGAGKAGKRPISVKFEIPYFTTSGIQVRYLKIIEPKVSLSFFSLSLYSLKKPSYSPSSFFSSSPLPRTSPLPHIQTHHYHSARKDRHTRRLHKTHTYVMWLRGKCGSLCRQTLHNVFYLTLPGSLSPPTPPFPKAISIRAVPPIGRTDGRTKIFAARSEDEGIDIFFSFFSFYFVLAFLSK